MSSIYKTRTSQTVLSARLAGRNRRNARSSVKPPLFRHRPKTDAKSIVFATAGERLRRNDELGDFKAITHQSAPNDERDIEQLPEIFHLTIL